MRNAIALLPLLILAGCATSAGPADKSTDKRAVEAAATPLADLNLIRSKIPPALNAARQGPYLMPADPSCASLATEVKALDEALGPDFDALRSQGDRSLADKGEEAAGNAAIGAIRDATDVIPFRGWVRRLSGAERHSREVAASIAAGGVRRAYLKGLAQARGCEAPPAPLRAAEPR